MLKSISSNGEVVVWNMEIKHNTPGVNCPSAKVTLNVPAGVSVTGPSDEGSTVINVPQGYYNISQNIWYLGILESGKLLYLPLEITVDDKSLAIDDRFTITATLTSGCTESNTENNVGVLVIEVTDKCTTVSISFGDEGENFDGELSIE